MKMTILTLNLDICGEVHAIYKSQITTNKLLHIQVEKQQYLTLSSQRSYQRFN